MISGRLEYLNTDLMTSRLLEYRTALNTRNTRKVRSRRNTLRIRKPPPIRFRDGRMQSRSSSAIGVKGYSRKESFPRLTL